MHLLFRVKKITNVDVILNNYISCPLLNMQVCQWVGGIDSNQVFHPVSPGKMDLLLGFVTCEPLACLFFQMLSWVQQSDWNDMLVYYCFYYRECNRAEQIKLDFCPFITRILWIYSCILIFSSDGQKMSKRKKNYPDPMAIVNSYGADALR